VLTSLRLTYRPRQSLLWILAIDQRALPKEQTTFVSA
jgi:hypothetical protein